MRHRRKPENILNFAEQADSESAEWVYHTLQDGDDGFYIVGDQLSALPGWQEGAVASALVAFPLCVKMKGFSPPKLRQVPFTALLVEGR